MSAIFHSFHPLFCDSDPFLTDKLIENYLGVVRVVKRIKFGLRLQNKWNPRS